MAESRIKLDFDKTERSTVFATWGNYRVGITVQDGTVHLADFVAWPETVQEDRYMLPKNLDVLQTLVELLLAAIVEVRAKVYVEKENG